jgi:hypothetical protein
MRKGIRGMKGAVLMETIQKENRPSATHTRLLMNAAGRWLMLNCKELGELILYFFSNDFLLTLEKKIVGKKSSRAQRSSRKWPNLLGIFSRTREIRYVY